VRVREAIRVPGGAAMSTYRQSRARVKALLLPVFRANPAFACYLRDQWRDRLNAALADSRTHADAEAIALAWLEWEAKG